MMVWKINIPLLWGPILRFYLKSSGVCTLQTTIMFFGARGPSLKKFPEDAMGERPPISMRKVNLSGAILRDWRPIPWFFLWDRDFFGWGWAGANDGIFFSKGIFPPPQKKCQHKFPGLGSIDIRNYHLPGWIFCLSKMTLRMRGYSVADLRWIPGPTYPPAIHFACLKCGCTIEASRNGMKGSVRTAFWGYVFQFRAVDGISFF